MGTAGAIGTLLFAAGLACFAHFAVTYGIHRKMRRYRPKWPILQEVDQTINDGQVSWSIAAFRALAFSTAAFVIALGFAARYALPYLAVLSLAVGMLASWATRTRAFPNKPAK